MAFFSRPQSRSAAVKIVAPGSTDESKDQSSTRPGTPRLTSPAKKDTTQRQCRNIMIHGYCKYEGKGCSYYHPPRDVQLQEVTPSDPPAIAESNSSSNGTSITAQAVNAPVFVPRAASAISAQRAVTSPPPPPQPGGSEIYSDPYNYMESSHEDDGSAYMDGLANQVDQMNFMDYGAASSDSLLMQADYDNMSAMNPYFQSQPVRQPLDYHLYTLPVPTTEGKKFFISDNIREELLKRSETARAGPAPGLHLPEDVKGYHSLVPLEIASDRKKYNQPGWNAMNYKATKMEDGRTYLLRRIDNYRLMNEQALTIIEKWRRIRHPGVVSVHEAFTCRTFGDHSLVVVYDFHPNSQTTAETYFKSKAIFQGGRVQPQERINESTLWSYIFQIASAMKAVHEAGLAVRMIDASKILITGQNRVKISACALFDILLYEAPQDTFLLQHEDMVLFAKLILSLCCNNPSATNHVQKSLDIVNKSFSLDMRNVIHYLMKPPGPLKNIQGLFNLFGSRLVTEYDAANATSDKLEGELMGELENSRLVRLLCKLGFINERPEFDRDSRWSETGDRYIIKLFRDYVFHSVDENTNPVVNLAHVLTNLNKLDAGSEERLMLVSRDEQSCLVVSYRDIKNCIESAFGDLSRGSR